MLPATSSCAQGTGALSASPPLLTSMQGGSEMLQSISLSAIKALFYSCKGPQVCINWSHVKVQLSRSMSSGSTVTPVQIGQLKCVSPVGPPSQPHLRITWPEHHHHGKEDSLSHVPWSPPRGCPGNGAPAGLAAQGGPDTSM